MGQERTPGVAAGSEWLTVRTWSAVAKPMTAEPATLRSLQTAWLELAPIGSRPRRPQSRAKLERRQHHEHLGGGCRGKGI